MVIPMDKSNIKSNSNIDLEQYEDIEDDDDYSTPVVLAYDSEDDDKND